MRAIIIEDDSNLIKGLKILLNRFGNAIELVAQSGLVVEGYDCIVQHLPEVLFLDIQITDGSSFDILEKLQKTHPEYKPQLVFITAYQEFAVKAFKFSALDYLLKPIDHLEFEAVIEKLTTPKEASPTYAQIEMLLHGLNKPNENKKIALHTQNMTHIVSLKDIIRCESSGNYTQFFLQDGKMILVSKTLKDFEDLLAKDSFERIHQSHLININYIKSLAKKDGFFIMTDGAEIPIASRKRELAQEIIGKIIENK